MSLPPEHISIKRSRQEEPVELLYLENDNHHTKRRFTDYCFQRLKVNLEAPSPSSQLSANVGSGNHRAANSHTPSGIPVVRATSPGAEIREEADRRADQNALRVRYLPGKDGADPTTPAASTSQKAISKEVSTQPTGPIAFLRRFHLHHDARGDNPNYSSGIRKRKTLRRNYLATFVEHSRSSRQETELLAEAASKQDSVLQSNTVDAAGYSQPGGGSLNTVPGRMLNTGQSMHDHPSTWDYDSDQLAEELAAFALEMSHNEQQDRQHSETPAGLHADIKNRNNPLDQGFIYDTYVRVPLDDGKQSRQLTDDVGLLIINDEDQELWQTYVESDDDSEWDEEDPDSNAEQNPANEYPEDEIDWEDELGLGEYKHRKLASDDEEYDLNEPWSDSE